jgi:3-oxoacyl-[acyl-carrier protein] reductase
MRRVAVITGGCGALGNAVARKLSASDADRIALVDLDEERLRDCVARLREGGRDAIAVACSVTNPNAIAGAMAELDGAGDTPAILVNAAGVPGRQGTRAAAEHVTDEEWRHTMEVNLTGAFYWCRAVIPAMRHTGYGRMVNVASLAARTASPTASLAYTASKAGLLGMTRALAAELVPHGILVNAVAPSRIVNDNWPDAAPGVAVPPPIGRFAEPEEVATVIAFLASRQNTYMTGATLDVNGGRFAA